jgi:hypothetical protein
MGLIETGSTLAFTAHGLVRVGNVELLYGCDGCEAKTGDPYAHLAWVIVARDRAVVDDSQVAGWRFDDGEDKSWRSRCYCAGCASEEPPTA